MFRILLPVLFFILAAMPVPAGVQQDPTLGVSLIGFARLPADVFVAGPVSGQFIAPANGRSVPFRQGQPVQGFSALLANGDGSFLALVDNGFGSRDNSPLSSNTCNHVARFKRRCHTNLPCSSTPWT